MYAKIKIFGDLYVKTGMHIGGSSAFAAIGAVDSPVIRDTRSSLPIYIVFPSVIREQFIHLAPQ